MIKILSNTLSIHFACAPPHQPINYSVKISSFGDIICAMSLHLVHQVILDTWVIPHVTFPLVILQVMVYFEISHQCLYLTLDHTIDNVGVKA